MIPAESERRFWRVSFQRSCEQSKF